MMKKATRILSIAVAVALVLCMLTIPAGAFSNVDKAEALVNTTNQTIEFMIAIAVAAAKLTPSFVDRILANTLKEQTDRLAEATIDKCADLGVDVTCEYELVYVDTAAVYIDPLKIC